MFGSKFSSLVAVVILVPLSLIASTPVSGNANSYKQEAARDVALNNTNLPAFVGFLSDNTRVVLASMTRKSPAGQVSSYAAAPPTVVTNNATGIAVTSARLNGTLVSLGSANSANVSFQWGMSSGNYASETSMQPANAAGTFRTDLSALSANTTYYFRAKAVGQETGYGSEISFTTSAPPTPILSPSVTTDNASSVGVTSARLNGTLVSLGSAASANVSFQWGTASGNYTSETGVLPVNTAGTFHADLSALSANTTYYFRAKAIGQGAGYGSEISFTTSAPLTPILSPAVTTNNASGVSATSARLNGTLVSLGSATSANVSFQWGMSSGNYASETRVQAANAAGTFRADLIALSANTTYYFRAKAVGQGTGYGKETSFTTPASLTPTSPGVTDVSAVVTASGVFDDDVTVKSDDGKTWLFIPRDTTGKDQSGSQLTQIIVNPMKVPPAPPTSSTIVGQVYDFGPDGATFDPPIRMTFIYDPGLLPAGFAEKNLVVAFLDNNSEWVTLIDCVVDPLARTVTVPLQHFTAYGVLAYVRPSNFTVSNLIITPGEVAIGEPVTIRALVTNTGDISGTYQVTFKVSNMGASTQSVTLAGVASQTVTFTTAPSTAGSYVVDVNGLVGEFTVKTSATNTAKPENWAIVAGIAFASSLVIATITWRIVRRLPRKGLIL